MWPSVGVDVGNGVLRQGVGQGVDKQGVLNCGMEKEDQHQKDEQMMGWFHHLMK